MCLGWYASMLRKLWCVLTTHIHDLIYPQLGLQLQFTDGGGETNIRFVAH